MAEPARGTNLSFAGAELVLDGTGALFWPAQDLLIVADLHLEKADAIARERRFLPPYDTRATLDRLDAVIARYAPRRLLSLGDGFHDTAGWAGLDARERRRLEALAARLDWLWLSGNHDPEPPPGHGHPLGAELEIAGIRLRHAPGPDTAVPEIAGHLHPKAALRLRGRRLTRPCFVHGQGRLLLPAFGQYTGGLDVCAPALATLLPEGCDVFLTSPRGAPRAFPRARLEAGG